MKAFYQRGEFHGSHGEIHPRVLPVKKAFTVNVFNLSGEPRSVGGSIDSKTLRLEPTLRFVSMGGLGTVEHGRCQASVKLPPWGAAVAAFHAQ